MIFQTSKTCGQKNTCVEWYTEVLIGIIINIYYLCHLAWADQRHC